DAHHEVDDSRPPGPALDRAHVVLTCWTYGKPIRAGIRAGFTGRASVSRDLPMPSAGGEVEGFRGLALERLFDRVVVDGLRNRETVDVMAPGANLSKGSHLEEARVTPPIATHALHPSDVRASLQGIDQSRGSDAIDQDLRRVSHRTEDGPFI